MLIVETLQKTNDCSAGTTQRKSGLAMQGLYMTDEHSKAILQKILVREPDRGCNLNVKIFNFQDTLGWFIKATIELSKTRDVCFP